MGVLRYKILRELWGNKGRTLQVALIIGISAGAIGMIIGLQQLLIPAMQASWQDANPAMIQLNLFQPISEDELLILKDVDGVVDIEGLSSTAIEWRLTPKGEWQPANLITRNDFENQIMFTLELRDGDWPEGEILSMGSDNPDAFGITWDQQVQVRVDDREKIVQFGGTIFDTQNSVGANFSPTATFFTTQENYEELVGVSGFSQVLVNGETYDEIAVENLADRLQDKLTKQEKDSSRILNNPEKHPAQDSMNAIFTLMGFMGLFSLVLGLLLIYNTINSLISQQTDQIGVMKAVGARTWQILRLYMTNILIYGVLSLMIALPIGVMGAWIIVYWIVTTFGRDDPGPFQYSMPAVIVQSAIALTAPILASIIPITNGARVTVREAISTYGLRTDTGFIERTLARIRYISRMVIITISNTFRHKWRVVMLQIALVLSGLIFMAVVSTRDSVKYTFWDMLFSILDADVTLVFEDPQRISYLEEITLAHPDVKAVEMWGQSSATIRPAGQEESEDDEFVSLFGVPLPTNLYGYKLRGGRWLYPEDQYAIVLNQELADEIGVTVGDWVTVKYGENHERNWKVVGLVLDPVIRSSANVPREAMLRDLGSVGRADSIWIQTVGDDPENDSNVAKSLRKYYEEMHIKVSPQRGIFNMGDSTFETASTVIGIFDMIIALIGVMAVVIGAVGSIALSGALSMSVIERRREIGVMRAIGASSWAIARLFIGEGLILGWLSWLIAFPLSAPVGMVVTKTLGAAFGGEFVFHYTLNGAIIWFLIITVLSVMASGFPSRGATRISVHESLAYQN